MAGPESKPSLDELAAKHKITIPVTFLPQGPSAGDLAPFKINPEAKNTILLYNKRKVHANFVNVDEKSFADVEKAAAEMLAK